MHALLQGLRANLFDVGGLADDLLNRLRHHQELINTHSTHVAGTTAQLPPESDYVFPKMQGRYVFKHAVSRMVEVVREVTAAERIEPGDVSVYLPHQANLRINQFVALELGLREDQVANNIERYGNTTAATIPMLLTETVAAGRIHDGDLVCMVAFGAGFTWGAALLRW